MDDQLVPNASDQPGRRARTANERFQDMTNDVGGSAASDCYAVAFLLRKWIKKLCRKPWFAMMLDDDFQSEERWFWLESSARKWAQSFGKHDDGSWRGCYAYMWRFPRMRDYTDQSA